MSEKASPEPESVRDLLVRRAVEGDGEALEELLAATGPGVRARIASKISPLWKSSLDEDDIMQVTYLEAFLEIERFSLRQGAGSEKAFGAWLMQIAENNLRDAIRGLERAKRPNPRNRVGEPSDGDGPGNLGELFGMHSLTPSRDAATAEAGDLLERAIASLPPDYATVINQYDLQGKSPEEIGKEMGRSTGAVYMLRARAHDHLRRSLGSASRFFSAPS